MDVRGPESEAEMEVPDTILWHLLHMKTMGIDILKWGIIAY